MKLAPGMVPGSDIRRRFAHALRARRKDLALTQEEAAERCGLHVRSWRALEAARVAAGLDTVQSIVDGLQLSWHQLADVIEPPRERAVPSRLHSQLDRAWEESTARERTILADTLGVLGAVPRVRR